MNKRIANASRNLPLKPLAACFALIFGFSGMSEAATLLVTDCTDGGGSGTLRSTIAAAASGDTVQIPVMCSTITLTTGHAISINVNDLTINGPGAGALTIDGGKYSNPATHNSVFYHLGNGTLYITGATIAHAKYTNGTNPTGGCIFSNGSVTLKNSTMTGCFMEPTSGTQNALGGAIYAKGSVSLKYSTVTNSTAAAYSGANGNGLGGGIYAKKGLFSKYSTISNNIASGAGTGHAFGGGAYVVGGGNVTINNSTISANQADRNSALHVSVGTGSYTVTIQNSTISGNSSRSIQTAGTYLPTTISNSTIAFNNVVNVSSSSPSGFYSQSSITMQSSIFANNTGNSASSELDVHSSMTGGLSGSNNLIVATNDSVPLGTLSGCPLLGPLTNNGGPTQTLPLLAGSPAINAGNNTGAFTDDQRGSGFARVVGASADIGAYELQSAVTPDRVFTSEFEGRCR